MQYTKREYYAQLDSAAKDMRSLWQHPLLNLRGRARGSGEPYTELAAVWLTDHWDMVERLTPVARSLPYRDPLRDGTRPRRLSDAGGILSRDLYARFHPGTGRRLHLLGSVLDYQMPLWDRPGGPGGKVDLVTWDGETLRLLTLLTRSSSDSMVRCLLASATHLQTVQPDRLRAEFSLPPQAGIDASPFVYLESQQKNDLEKHPAALRRLFLRSGLRPIYYIP